MFRREKHRQVLSLLSAFDSEKLARCKFLFGGGTRIVLELGEYRESQDVDFLCSDGDGYAELRYAAAVRGYDSLFRETEKKGFRLPREMRIDQYGIRFPVEIAASLFRVELIREARVDLDPGVRPDWSPVDCLAISDCYTEKILASSDRWADRQTLSRDLIDLSALRTRMGPIPEKAWRKVERAYKTAGRDDLLKALSAFDQDVSYQQRCFEGLNLDDPSMILRGMDQLHAEIGSQSQNHPPG